MLACTLALRMPFKTQTVSIIAFSLGAQVAKSCLKYLHEIFAPIDQGQSRIPQDIIQSVTFLAGACHFSKHTQKYRDIFSSTVNGQIKNVYSHFDRMLYLFEQIQFQKQPIGRNPIILYEDEESSVWDSPDEHVINHNVS